MHEEKQNAGINKIYLVTGVLITIIGAVGLVLGLGSYSGAEPVTGYTTRVVVLLWGLLLVLCGKNKYKGGFYSAIGSIFIGVGVIALVRSLELGYFGNTGDGYGIALAYFLIFGLGFLLISRGHKLHLKEKDIKGL